MANATTIQIQVRIERDTAEGTFCDALYYTPAEFYKLNGTRNVTDLQIESAAAQRVANYVSRIAASRLLPPAPPATSQELFGWMSAAQIAQFEAWKAAR